MSSASSSASSTLGIRQLRVPAPREPRQQQLQRAIAAPTPQRGFSSFRHRARSWPRSAASATRPNTRRRNNLRFLIPTALDAPLRSSLSNNDRGECENRIEEFKNASAPTA